ncbi:hypothetical protein [Candidatus Erwinia dacicola]|uniref:Uncharacterized protein n=1 Tax=Candidatus Erwinia dacicola TaxID=252393 RepID=A0A1E7YW89_9GAMM|nr:hypothetical protein [Candidatus Erwinia dacicola]NJD00708.1 hypothetical protein [Candidatus Erwinia dacicola]OFC60797.1 hypothetical protein BBW68_14225 [Candidatus Erwinia dacicola]
MGLRPCSGAIKMLLFAKVIGVYAWGVLSAIVMALVVQMSHARALRLSKGSSAQGWLTVAVNSLALMEGGLLVMLVMSGGIRPMFLR